MLIQLTLTFLVQAQVQAQTQAQPKMSISYGSPSWNTDSRTMDSAYMVLRDKTTGKIVQIQLEETEPDSSKFDGRFSVDLGHGPLNPEVFVPPTELRNPERDYQKVHDLILANKLKNKPLIIKKDEAGLTILDVYDTDEQAQAARRTYDEEERLRVEAEHQKFIQPVPDEKHVKATMDSEAQALMAKIAVETARRESARVRMEQIERQKTLEREKAMTALSEKQKAERMEKTKSLADEAMVLFNKGDFANAESKFRQSVDLDPNNKAAYFSYGVTLYKNNKFNEALVTLKLADVDPTLIAEKNYFMGLTHYRLNELSSAETNFVESAKSSDPIIGPSSMFYLGVVQFTKGQLAPAKANFEKVIDTSQDPRMDAEAETYIERIAQAMLFKKLQEQPWTTTGVVGVQYDSNVLLTPDNTGSQGSQTKESDLRLNTVADIGYRAIYSQHHDLTLKGNANLTNSAQTKVSRADPFLFNFSTPYSHKGVLFKKGHVVSLRPAYEMLYMDPSSSGTKTKILNAIVIGIDNTFVMNPTWMATYTLEGRQDDFTLNGSTGDDNYDAMKYTLKTTQIFYRDKNRKEAVTATLGYTLNNAQGKNKKFTRYDLAANYTRPMKWGYSWTLELSAYQLDYNQADDKRSDFNVVLMTGIDKPIRDWVKWSVTGAFTKNDSTNETSYEYDKFLIMPSATFSTNF